MKSKWQSCCHFENEIPHVWLCFFPSDSAIGLGLCLFAGVFRPWARSEGLGANGFIKELILSSVLEGMASREVPSYISSRPKIMTNKTIKFCLYVPSISNSILITYSAYQENGNFWSKTKLRSAIKHNLIILHI